MKKMRGTRRWAKATRKEERTAVTEIDKQREKKGVIENERLLVVRSGKGEARDRSRFGEEELRNKRKKIISVEKTRGNEGVQSLSREDKQRREGRYR